MSIRTATAAIAIALGAGAAAHAGTVDLKFIGTGQGRNVHFDLNGYGLNVFAGQLLHQFTNGVGDGAQLVGTHVTFCTDLLEYVTTTPKTYQVVGVKDVPSPSMGQDRADAIMDMYRYANGAQLLSNANNDFAAAFQIAIWEVANDFNAIGGRGSLDVTTGAFEAKQTNGSALSSAIMTNLNSLFNAIGTYRGDGGPGFQVFGLARQGAQDQLVVVPLSPAGMMAGVGLIGVAGLRRRRRL